MDRSTPIMTDCRFELEQIKARADSNTSMLRLIDDEMRGQEQLGGRPPLAAAGQPVSRADASV